MSSLTDHIHIVSYNCRGWNSGQIAVCELLQSCDICLIQEHWLFHDQLNLLNIDSNLLFVGVSAMDSSKLLLGRPYGGCAILFRRSLISCISRLDSPSKHFCAVRLQDNAGSTTLIVCVYLPFSDGSSESSNEFLVTLGELEGFIDRYSSDYLIIAGDLNVDFNRTSVNCQNLVDFMNDLHLVSADQLSASGIAYTYMRDDGHAYSWPDHFLSYHSHAHRLSDFRTLDSGSNLSDHSPLFCSYSVDLTSASPPSIPSSFTTPSRLHVAWHKASPDNFSSYCKAVSDHLPRLLDSVVGCCDPSCTTHHLCMDKFCDYLACCLDHAARKTLPLTHPTSTVAGWNHSARGQKANFWHRVWKQAGSPSAGVLHQLKKLARSRYKYEVRRLKRRELHIRRWKMAQALASSNTRSFWQQVQRVNKAQKPHSACSIDGHRGASNITRLFSSKLQGILNSQDVCERDSLHSHIFHSLQSDELVSVTISEECVIDAFSHLKRGKSDGSVLLSDHLIYALPVVCSSLANLFTAILRHGYMPSQLKDCILVPIPKNAKDPSVLDNYRAIALAPTLSKALEWCILLTHKEHFKTSELQFGFKQNMSTSLCTGVLKNVVSRYMLEGSPVFSCFLDASKAFDLVNHNILFSRLLSKGFPPYLVRFFLTWYKEQRMCVRWESSFSDSFSVANGVRQGGVLSPILFTLYIDDLLMDLKDQGVGCFWDSYFVGALCYADDLVLLAPSPSALRMMIRCCEDFAVSHGLRFNASKTQLIRFSHSLSSSCHVCIQFCGQQLSFIDTVTHLGHLLNYNLSDAPDINHKLRDMVRKANYVLVTFPSVGPLILTRLFQSYCLSLYGSCLWSLSSPTLHSIEVAFNKILRKIWNLPRHSHTRIVHSVANLSSLFNIVSLRSHCLLLSALNSSSLLVKQIFSDSCSLCCSFCGYNFMFGSRHFKTYFEQDRLCADVIRSLRCSHNSVSLSPDYEDMIMTISCD